MMRGSPRGAEEGRRRKQERGTKTPLHLTVITTASLVLLAEMMMDTTDEGVGEVVEEELEDEQSVCRKRTKEYISDKI